MLQISHLYKNYGKFQAVRDLNLHVPKGDLFGFVSWMIDRIDDLRAAVTAI